MSKVSNKPPLNPSAKWLGDNVNMDEIPDDDDCGDPKFAWGIISPANDSQYMARMYQDQKVMMEQSSGIKRSIFDDNGECEPNHLFADDWKYRTNENALLHVKENGTDRTVRQLKYLCNFQNAFYFEALAVAIKQLPENHRHAVCWRKLQYRRNAKTLIHNTQEEMRSEYYNLCFSELCDRYMQGTDWEDNEKYMTVRNRINCIFR